MTLRTALAAAVLVCLGPLAPAFAQQLPDLRFTEERFDIGCVGVDFKIRHTFRMVNHGAQPIHIDTVTAHCDCTEVRFRDSTVAPGDTAEILMIFSTANFYGFVEKDVRVVSNDPKMPAQEILYSAVVGQWLLRVEPKPTHVIFLPPQRTRTAELVNHALDKISVKDVYIEDPFVDIKIVDGEASKGETVKFELTPKTDLPSGTHLTNYTVTINPHRDAPPLRITIPVKVARY
ncbi:MAG: DUF1573 domain-containing protein [Candidatus Zixiibacteriota bacterium]